jgi:hypothetical protein
MSSFQSFYLGMKAEFSPSNPTHSLLRFLLTSNSLDLIIDIACELWGTIVGFVPPYALKQILSALEDPQDRSAKSTAYCWALITFVAHVSFAQVDMFQTWHTRRCYERTRGTIFCALHYKALTRLDVSGKMEHENDSEGEASADLGKIVNLMQSVLPYVTNPWESALISH